MQWYEDEVRTLEERIKVGPIPRHPVAFYGSSSIRLWSTLASDLALPNALNLGFGGSTLEACAWFFERLVVPAAPASLVVYAGDNDWGTVKARRRSSRPSDRLRTRSISDCPEFHSASFQSNRLRRGGLLSIGYGGPTISYGVKLASLKPAALSPYSKRCWTAVDRRAPVCSWKTGCISVRLAIESGRMY